MPVCGLQDFRVQDLGLHDKDRERPTLARHGQPRSAVPTWVVVLMILAAASSFGQVENKSEQSGTDYSGMYTFLQEGEFLQLTIEDRGQVSGFISRYNNSDHQGFADHFFKQGRVDGKKLTFSTEIVQNVSYDFKGTVDRGEGKKPADDAYYVLKGTLTQNTIDAGHKIIVKSQAVVFKSFPQDVGDAK